MFAEPLADFFRDFARPATLAGQAIASGVLFEAEYAEALGGVVGGNGPAATAIATEVAGVTEGAALVLAAVNTLPAASYTVRGIEPDGTGLVVLRLQAV